MRLFETTIPEKSTKARWSVFTLYTVLPLVAVLAAACLSIYYFFPAQYKLLALLLYSIPAEFVIALVPHEPLILYYSKFSSPAAVAAAALVGTLWVEYLNYALVRLFFNIPKISELKNRHVFQKTIDYFLKAPFLSVAVAAITPVPFYPFRIIASASGYSVRRYLAAVAIGRCPRFYILAYFGYVVPLSNKIIIILFVVLFAALVYSWVKGGKFIR